MRHGEKRSSWWSILVWPAEMASVSALKEAADDGVWLRVIVEARGDRNPFFF